MKICIHSGKSDHLPLEHGGLEQRRKCLITTFTPKYVSRLAVHDLRLVINFKHLLNEAIKVTCH